MRTYLWIAGPLYIAIVFSLTATSSDAQVDHSRKVDQLFAKYDNAKTPGCNLGVIRNGSFIYKRSYGAASLELGVPLTPQSIFDLGSISKQLTAASVVLAAEQGFLKLDDDVRKYLPELPSYGKPITLRQMLNHTSGLRDLQNLMDFSGRNPEDLHSFAEIFDLIVRQKSLNFQPGDEYVYSNTNYFLLGEIVHRTTGKTLAQFAEENIFKPLGMSHTRFYDDHTLVVPGRVMAYDTRDEGGFNVNWSANHDRIGDGGVMSSVEDLLVWDRNFYANKLGKGGLVEEMLKAGVLNDGETIHYGLGLGLSKYRGLSVIEHGGSIFGYRSEIVRFAEQKLSVICLCNLGSIDPEGLAMQVADIYLEGNFHDEPGVGPSTESEQSGLAGTYRNPANHSAAEVVSIPGGVQVRGIHMKKVGPQKYESLLGRFEARFEPNSDGSWRMTFHHSFAKPQVFEKFVPMKPSAEDLAQYAGEYVSEELDATYKFTVKGSQLLLRINWTDLPPFFEPGLRDEFHGPDDTAIAFRRDASGRIVGCDVYTDRVLHLSLLRR